jgi:uncharacterized damage-inducible protein DinB
MPVSPDTLLSHIEYSAWASGKLVEAAARLTPEELNHDFQTADRSILGTLVHVFAADRVWLARVLGQPNPPFVTEADQSLAVLQNHWPAIHQGWKDWARGLSEQDVNSTLTYRDLKGNQWSHHVWKLVLHVVNHATHHRGQAAGFLRTLGHTPPSIDLIFYYRELG